MVPPREAGWGTIGRGPKVGPGRGPMAGGGVGANGQGKGNRDVWGTNSLLYPADGTGLPGGIPNICLAGMGFATNCIDQAKELASVLLPLNFYPVLGYWALTHWIHEFHQGFS